jgi:hypothetical protein
MRSLIALLVVLAACAAPAPQPPVSTPAGQRDLDTLVSFFTGNWESKPRNPPMLLRVGEFWKGGSERWLYLEWTRPGEAQPARQRVLRIAESADKNMTGAVYRLPDPARVVGEWARPQPFAGMRPEEMRMVEDCRMRVVRTMTMAFTMVTEGMRCPGDIAGSPYMRYEFSVTSSDLDVLEQPRDAAGNVPAGSRLEPFHYARMSREPR